MSRRNNSIDWSSSDNDSLGNLEDLDDLEDDSEGEDDLAEEENLDAYSICTNPKTGTPHASIALALSHDVQIHGFDMLRHLPSPTEEDFFERVIIFINKCRSFVASLVKDNLNPKDVGRLLNEFLEGESCKNVEEDNNFFMPFLQDDVMLMCVDDIEDLMIKRSDKESSKDAQDDEPSRVATETVESLQIKVKELEGQLCRAKNCISSLTNGKIDKNRKNSADNDTYYFSSYSHSSIHETMLKDSVRTDAYRDAILKNSNSLFKDKVVMDIGCGTGILSLFAAKAGAKKVIAVDASDVHVEAREIVHLNGYNDVIHVVHGKIEDLISKNQLPLEKDEKVNVIISEWMGYALLFETMLPSVMTARDTFMEETGTMFPNHSNILLEGASDSEVDYWDDVYGFNMKPMKDRVVKEIRKEASVEIVKESDILTNRVELTAWDLNTCKDEDLDFTAPFELKACDGRGSVTLNKLVVSFDIAFDLPEITPVTFSTGCQSQPTHWQQTTLWFDTFGEVPLLEEGDILKGDFKMSRNKVNPRDMDFFVIWSVGTLQGSGTFKKKRSGIINTKLGA